MDNDGELSFTLDWQTNSFRVVLRKTNPLDPLRDLVVGDYISLSAIRTMDFKIFFADLFQRMAMLLEISKADNI